MTSPPPGSVRIDRATDAVRAAPREDWSIATLARVAHYSPFHFARVFRAHTGETVNHFVQRARLEGAVRMMVARPERDLTDIALEAGFSASSDFSRVFKRHYGIAPSHWDRQSRLVGAEPPGFSDQLEAARRTLPSLRPVCIERPASRIAAERVATPFLDADLLDAGLDDLMAWAERRGLPACPIVGLSNHTSVEVRFEGTLGHIALAWDFLYEEWLPISGREPADLPAMKRFHAPPDAGGWRAFELSCCIPLR